MENSYICDKITEAFAFEPLLYGTALHPDVNDGIVKLDGIVANLAQKILAESLAKNLTGIKKVINNIIVKSIDPEMTDKEILSELQQVFKSDWLIPHRNVNIKVDMGVVTLTGTVRWKYQKGSAFHAAIQSKGVKDVINNILLQGDVDDAIEKEAIELRLKHNWSINCHNIIVGVKGNSVHLSGMVPSVRQKDQVEEIAWSTPGVWDVENDIVVDY